MRSPLDPLALLQHLRGEQAALARLSGLQTTPEESAADESLARFLVELSTLWRDGEARPTHRQAERVPRHWRTRVDPFATGWTEIEGWLIAEPEATAKELFQRLRAAHPGAYTAGQLRRLQRRVREWRRAMARRLIFGCQEEPSGAAPTSGSEGELAEAVSGARAI